MVQPVPEPVHGATPELGKWLRDNEVQAARFDRGNLVEVVLMDRRDEQPAKERDADESTKHIDDEINEALGVFAREQKRGHA